MGSGAARLTSHEREVEYNAVRCLCVLVCFLLLFFAVPFDFSGG